MNRIEKFEYFKNESLKTFGSKMRRTVTGQSAGEEIEKLSKSQQEKILNLYKEDPNEAARYLRSIIIKEKNNQFGIGLALTIAGSGMIYKASNFQPPNTEEVPNSIEEVAPKPDVEISGYEVKKGDSWWKIAENELVKQGNSSPSNAEIAAYHKQLASHNGANYLYSGKHGSPGLEPDTWRSLDGETVSKSVITKTDRLFPGQTIEIIPYTN
jgi:hypothetical protein